MLPLFKVEAEDKSESIDDHLLSQLVIDTDELMKDLSNSGMKIGIASNDLDKNNDSHLESENKVRKKSYEERNSQGQSYSLPRENLVEKKEIPSSSLILGRQHSDVMTDAEVLKEYINKSDGKSRFGFYYKIKKMGRGHYGNKEKVKFSLVEKSASGQNISTGNFMLNYDSLPPLLSNAINLVGRSGEVNIMTTASNMYKSSGIKSNLSSNKVLDYNIKLE